MGQDAEDGERALAAALPAESRDEVCYGVLDTARRFCPAPKNQMALVQSGRVAHCGQEGAKAALEKLAGCLDGKAGNSRAGFAASGLKCNNLLHLS